MSGAQIFTMLKFVAGGLGVFLLGMKMMSDGMQALAGARISRWIGAITNNRFLAVLTGLGVTCVIQSSSATTVMVVGFVNSGLMSLTQAIGVILGSNVGTSLSIWIIALDVSRYGALLLGLATFPYIFAKTDRTLNLAMSFLGVGMLFFGLELMSEGFMPLRDSPEIHAWFHSFQADSLINVWRCALVGCFATALLQSSHVTIAITISLAQTGLISFDSALALVLGTNVGTTITALLAALGTNRGARRAALAHALFNAFGVLWVTLVFHVFFAWSVKASTLAIAKVFAMAPAEGLPPEAFAYPRLGIAIAHTVFNIANAAVFIPFITPFARLITWIVPLHPAEQANGAEVYKPVFLDPLMTKTPAVAIAQSHKEIVAMGETDIEMLRKLATLVGSAETDPDAENFINIGEERLDDAQHAVMRFVSRILMNNLTESMTIEARRQLRRADEFESVSDYIRQAMRVRGRLLKNDGRLSADAVREMAELNRLTLLFAERVVRMIRARAVDQVPAARRSEKDLQDLNDEYRMRHLARLANDEVTASKSILYSDVLVAYERMKDHLVNIVDTLVD